VSEKWKLPKNFVPEPTENGSKLSHDGEPAVYELTKHPNDATLITDRFIECCDCGLTHHHTYNVVRNKKGKWYLVERSYRVPGTGKP